ncbi:MAG: 7,8-didemethyl-8-hydroxy-5-deazariboflavin synthase subunit CofH [Methanobacteriota archaeon]|nr:MAG: 7,8-didemethyl-8-hydroxy-5-deazariboflavin synthase subunit CofH [Euryarchaeota archaeon]
MLLVEEELSGILEKRLSGGRISKEEAYRLLLSGSLFSLGEAADRLREKSCGDRVSYVVNRNINFTNICTGSCSFCAYRVRKGDPSGYLMSHERILRLVEEAVAVGATEVCIQGGLNPDIGIDYYTGMLETITSSFDIHIHAFSPMEVFYMAEKSGLGIAETLRLLKEKGLGSMPGTAAEILDREVREEICPRKITAEEWVDIVKTAHHLGIPTTATMLYGHVERPEHRINHLDIIRRIQDETGGFTEFVPLSFVHYNTPLGKANPEAHGASGLEDLMVHAISRLFLDNIPNIQASWVKLGWKLAQTALFFGANDLGGTLMDESISRAAGQKVSMMDEAQMRRLIEDVGRKPARRDTLYRFLE